MSRSKDKGTRKERQVVELAQQRGFEDAHRLVLSGAKDKGDIGGIDNLTVEVKYRGKGQPLALSSAVDEAVDEAVNAGNAWALAAVHRHRRPVEDTYAVMRLGDFLDLYRDYLDALEGTEAAQNLATRATEAALRPTDRNLVNLSAAVAAFRQVAEEMEAA